MHIIEAGTKLEIIIKVLDAVIGWAIIDRNNGGYVAVEKGRESCRHKDTNHGEHCCDPTNVPCNKWEPLESLLESNVTAVTPKVCGACTTVYDSTLKECPGCIEEADIADHLVKCDLSGCHVACVQCNHGAAHVALNDCASIKDDMCSHIERNVNCVPLKEA